MSSTFLVRSISAGTRRRALRMMGSTLSGSGSMSFVKQKSSKEQDNENDEEEEETRAPIPADSPKTPHLGKATPFSARSRVPPAVTRDFSHLELSMTDDVLSSMTRSFESRQPHVEQEDLGLLRPLMGWSIDPDSTFAFYWKAAVTAAVLYNWSVVILRTAFAEMRSEVLFTVLDLLCDIIYILDIVFESKTSFLDDGCVVTDSNKKFKHYRGKQQFAHDIISVLPIHTLVVQVAYSCEMLQLAAPELRTFWKYLHSYHSVLRLNRLLKCHTMDRFFQKTESRTNKPNLLRAFKLSLQLGLVIHWIACLYYMLSEYEGLGTNDWVYPLEPNATRFSRKYILCMFWSTMTLTTIGERPPPTTEMEYLFTGFTFLVGVFVFAAVVGNVGDVISNMNAARRDFQARMDQIKFYMNHRNVPEHLQNRIKRWAEYTWDRTKAIDEPNAMQFLPDRLRTEVAIHVHLTILKQVSIFADCEEGLLRELVLKLRPQIFSPGDYICRIGEIGRDMYIINHGKVEILFPDFETGALIQVAVMHPGNFFGEISLLKLDDGQNKRTADVRSVGFSELLCLSRRDLIVALAEYPEAKKLLEDYARQRFNNTKRLTSQDTDDSRNVSPQVSYASFGNKRTARQTFSKVMKTQRFIKLLGTSTKNKELMEIKAAVDELKAAKNLQAEQHISHLQKKVQELEKMVLDKNMELQESQIQIRYLEKVIQNHCEVKSSSKVTELPLHGKVIIGNGIGWQQQGLNQVTTVPQTPQDNMSVSKDENLTEDYCFNTKSLKKCKVNYDKSFNNLCALRRTYFRTAIQQNVNSSDSISVPSSASSYGESSVSLQNENAIQDEDKDNVNTRTVSPEHARPLCSLLVSRSPRHASAPYPTLNVCDNLRTYTQHSATVHSSYTSGSYLSSCIHAPQLTGKPSGMENRCKFMPARKFLPELLCAVAEKTSSDRKTGFSGKSSAKPICTLKNKHFCSAPTGSDSSAMEDRYHNRKCHMSQDTEDDKHMHAGSCERDLYAIDRIYRTTRCQNTKKKVNDLFVTSAKTVTLQSDSDD